jgi:hypothetical protein
MKSIIPACCLMILGAAVARADPADDAIVAGMKLSASPNYSWTTTTDRGAQTAVMRGQTNSSGYSLVTFVGYSLSGGSSGGRSSGSGNEIPAVFLGDSKYVVQGDGGWTTPSALPDNSSSSSSNGTGRTRSGSGGGLSGGGTGLSTGRRSGSRSSRSSNTDSGTGGLPGLPAGINLPHEELAIIVANYTDLHSDGSIASGGLTEIGVDLLLVPPGSNDTPPEGATGTFRLWISDGIVTKYEVKVSAKTGPGGKAVSGGFSETITVEFKNVGSTTFDVPDAAKRRLGG